MVYDTRSSTPKHMPTAPTVLPPHLARPRKEFPNALEDGIRKRLGCKADDEPLLRQGAQVLDHAIDAILGVVDHHIQARDGVVAACGEWV